MNVFMVFVRDQNFCQLLPEELDRSRGADGRLKVMGFPPLGIQTLAPVLPNWLLRTRWWIWS